jgi:radical SAM superfamily enzyme YgiQ (UPF0313 family)
MKPDQPLRCLLVHPAFDSESPSFWNFKQSCTLLGAHTLMPPIGLVTAAAILPQIWNFRLRDLNVSPISEEDWEWADLVCVGGMLTQHPSAQATLREAKSREKFVVVGGSGATNRPDDYPEADALVLGEAEVSVPLWLDSWRLGEPRGVFQTSDRADMTRSPIPRFDLLRFEDYMIVGVQATRGCPFLCEFCDIIEVFGRVPRTKTTEQFVAELEALYELGHRGAVEIVDDNFVGNKRDVKVHLKEIIRWSKRRKHPFYFIAEASMNAADDPELLGLMRDADFRIVFMGIETPDPDVLRAMHKSQNIMRPIIQRLEAMYEHGMVVCGSFVIGFDGEKAGSGEAMIRCIEQADIGMAGVELLVALPNTQLTRRLLKEGRMSVPEDRTDGPGGVRSVGGLPHVGYGLNFVTARDREEILGEFDRVIQTVYDPRGYMDRLVRLAKRLKMRPKHRPAPREFYRYARALWRLSLVMTRDPSTRWLYWRTLLRTLPLGYARFEAAMLPLIIYVDFRQHASYLSGLLAARREHLQGGQTSHAKRPGESSGLLAAQREHRQGPSPNGAAPAYDPQPQRTGPWISV